MKAKKKSGLDEYIYIRIPAEAKRQIEQKAAEEGSNMTIWVRQLIMRALSSQEPLNPESKSA